MAHPRTRVFPTPVGMDRRRLRQKGGSARFPHTRGDGPRSGRRSIRSFRFSPHPWGWTDRPMLAGPQRRVFPTPVGMNRLTSASRRYLARFPHTRGDGPDRERPPEPSSPFSPHPWGWTDAGAGRSAAHRVFPTPVGMDLQRQTAAPHACGFPHTRGDGPPRWIARHYRKKFSPHPWGWTGGYHDNRNNSKVFPTPVGMDRTWRKLATMI